MKPLELKKLQELILYTALADYRLRQSLPSRKAPIVLELVDFFREIGVQRVTTKLLVEIRETIEFMVGPAVDKLHFDDTLRQYVIYFNGEVALEYPFLFFGSTGHKIPDRLLAEFEIKNPKAA